MKPNNKFVNLPDEFWANLKLVSQRLGYAEKGTGHVKVYDKDKILELYETEKLDAHWLFNQPFCNSTIGDLILEYSTYRAEVLNSFVEKKLMKKEEAKKYFKQLKKELKPTWETPMNKQKGLKKGEAYFTGIINMLIEENMNGSECDYNPKTLITFTHNDTPYRILSRHVDGAFPCVKDPIAIWEIKEYYNTTTFGSRVADGIYEVVLDGMELREINSTLNRNVKNYLMVDAYQTWWLKGKSYLCRIIDLLHMGLITEALFGKEVIERLPMIVKDWG